MKNSLNFLLLILVMSVNSLIAASSSSSSIHQGDGAEMSNTWLHDFLRDVDAASFDSDEDADSDDDCSDFSSDPDDVGPDFFKIPLSYEQHLCSAIERQSFVEVCHLLDTCVMDLNALSSSAGYAPIHLAVNYDPEVSGADSILRRLMSMPGLDVNRINTQGVTALHIAAWSGNEEAVALLLQNGADTMLRAYLHAPAHLCNKTAAEIAESEEYFDIAEKINKFGRSKRIAALSLSRGKKLPPSKLSQISTNIPLNVDYPTVNGFALYLLRVSPRSKAGLLKTAVVNHARKRLEITPAPDQENNDASLKRQRR